MSNTIRKRTVLNLCFDDAFDLCYNDVIRVERIESSGLCDTLTICEDKKNTYKDGKLILSKTFDNRNSIYKLPNKTIDEGIQLYRKIIDNKWYGVYNTLMHYLYEISKAGGKYYNISLNRDYTDPNAECTPKQKAIAGLPPHLERTYTAAKKHQVKYGGTMNESMAEVIEKGKCKKDKENPKKEDKDTTSAVPKKLFWNNLEDEMKMQSDEYRIEYMRLRHSTLNGTTYLRTNTNGIYKHHAKGGVGEWVGVYDTDSNTINTDAAEPYDYDV